MGVTPLNTTKVQLTRINRINDFKYLGSLNTTKVQLTQK